MSNASKVIAQTDRQTQTHHTQTHTHNENITSTAYAGGKYTFLVSIYPMSAEKYKNLWRGRQVGRQVKADKENRLYWADLHLTSASNGLSAYDYLNHQTVKFISQTPYEHMPVYARMPIYLSTIYKISLRTHMCKSHGILWKTVILQFYLIFCNMTALYPFIVLIFLSLQLVRGEWVTQQQFQVTDYIQIFSNLQANLILAIAIFTSAQFYFVPLVITHKLNTFLYLKVFSPPIQKCIYVTY